MNCVVIIRNKVWQICQQSLKIISIEQSFVRGNYTFSELCSSRKYPFPHKPHTPLPTEDRNCSGRGGPKGGNFRGVGGLLTVAYRGFLTRHPWPVTRYLSPATRGKVLPPFLWSITQVRTYIRYIFCNRRRTLFNITTMAGSFCVLACFCVTLSQFVPLEMYL